MHILAPGFELCTLLDYSPFYIPFGFLLTWMSKVSPRQNWLEAQRSLNSKLRFLCSNSSSTGLRYYFTLNCKPKHCSHPWCTSHANLAQKTEHHSFRKNWKAVTILWINPILQEIYCPVICYNLSSISVLILLFFQILTTPYLCPQFPPPSECSLDSNQVETDLIIMVSWENNRNLPTSLRKVDRPLCRQATRA